MKISDRIQLMALKWDSTKEPHKTERFIDDVLHLISQLEGGEWMVYFLNHFLCRAKKNETFPTFMGGSVFDLTPSRTTPRPLDGVDPGEEEEEDEGAQPSAHSADIVGGGEMQRAPVIDYIKRTRGSISSTATSAEKRFGEVPHELTMGMWPEKVQRLDRILHSTLLTLVSGPKSDYIRNVPRPSLCMALSNLWINDQVTRCDRQMRAFETMQKLEYKSDIDAFNVAAHKAITELAASGATMESIMMICLRNAFHSRGQYIRMEIGKDMDDNPNMGISQVLDCLHKYCNMVSSSGEGGGKLPPHDVNYIEGEGGDKRTMRRKPKGKGKIMERRMADDGEQYTLKEFRDYYGDEAQELWDAAEVPSKEPSVETAKEDAKQPDEEPESEDKKIFNIEAMKEWWQSVKRPSDQRRH